MTRSEFVWLLAQAGFDPDVHEEGVVFYAEPGDLLVVGLLMDRFAPPCTADNIEAYLRSATVEPVDSRYRVEVPFAPDGDEENENED